MDPYRRMTSREVNGWLGVIDTRPMSLSDALLSEIEPNLTPSGRAILKHLLDSLNRQTAWIEERTTAMRDEAERIALLGQTMRKAGLRSYTDDKGRIFVASESESEGTDK